MKQSVPIKLSLSTLAAATSMLALASPAQAQNECGAPPAGGGTVVCPATGNPYPNGIFYIAPDDLTIVLEDGVTVNSSGSLNNGVFGIAGSPNSAITVSGATNTSITTSDSGANGALIATTYGDINVALDQISTSGNSASGIFVSSAGGLTSASANNISTTGNGAEGITANTNNGNIVIDSGTITTAGTSANGINARSDFANLTITADSVTTSGASNSNGILASTGGPGTITVDAGTISTIGDASTGIRATNNSGAVLVSADDVTTSGNGSEGISIVSAGTVGIDAGTVSTAGTGANGIQAQAGGGATIAFDSVTTTGDNAVGVLVPQGALFFGPRFTPSVSITGGDVSTTGDNSDAIRAVASAGAVNMNLTGDISTAGANSRGIFASAPTGVTITGGANVTTTGDGSNAVEVSSTTGPIDLTLGDISTSGALSRGVLASGGTNSNVVVTTGDVTTTGTAGSNYSFFPTSTAITATSQGTGNVTVTSGDISTAGLGALGINASAQGTGDVVINSGNVATTGARAPGVNAYSAGGDVQVTTGTVSTGGDTSAGIYAVARNGGVTVDADTITTTGFNSRGVNAIGGVGGVDVGFTNINTSGTFSSGVSAISTGGDVTVSGANINATGASTYALYASSDVGDVNVTTTGTVASTGRGGTGIFASSGTGDVLVTANNVTTVAANPADTATSRAAINASGANATVVTTGSVTMAGRSLYGGNPDAITVTGTAGNASATVNNVSATGDGSRAVVVTATGDASATVNGAVRATGALSDALVVTGGDNAVVNVASGGSVLASGGNSITLTSVNGSTLNNAGTIANNAGGFALAAFGGPITINNTGSLTSDFVLTPGDDIVNNPGTFIVGPNPDFGTGIDVFNNSGSVLVGNGGLTPTAATFVGLETFNNVGGTVDLRNGVVGDTLTLPGNYVGSAGATLGIDVNGSAPGLQADQLIIGGNASGSTMLTVNNTGGPVLLGGPVLVVDAATATTDAFVLGNEASTPLIQYGLLQTGGDFFLTSAATAQAFQPLTFGGIGQDLWYQSADSYLNMATGRRGADVSRHNGFGMWADLYVSRDRYGDRNDTVTLAGADYEVNNRVRNHRAGGQIGFDYAPGNGPLMVGMTLGYERNKASLSGSDQVTADGYNVGAYAMYAPETGIYGGLLVKYDSADLDLGDTVFDVGSPRLHSTGFDGEVGYRFGSGTMDFDVNAGLSRVRTKVEDFSFGGIDYNFDNVRSTRGRIGVRAGFGGALGPFVGAKLLHEFKGDSDVTFGNAGIDYDLSNRGRGTWGRVEAGLDGGRTGGVTTALWADVGSRKGIGARLGFRF